MKTTKATEQELREKGKKQTEELVAKNKAKKPYVAKEFEASEAEEKEILKTPGKTTKKPLPEKEKVLKPEKPAKKEKAAKEEKETLHRQDSVTQAIKELCKTGATMKQIMERADAIHVAKGGESNPTATNVNRYTLFALVSFNILLLSEKGIYTLNK
jgi:hypothetical protein